MPSKRKIEWAEKAFQTEKEIVFRDHVANKGEDTWPARHKSKLHDINKTLGKAVFEEWQAEMEKNDDKSYGNQQLRHHVQEIAARAQRLYEKKGSESDWRQSIEPLVFKRFDSDVYCWACKKRLWVPRLDTPWTSGPIKSTICECNPAHSLSRIPRIDQLFDMRSEYSIQVNVSDDGKTENKRPDKVVGLRRAGSLVKTTHSRDKRQNGVNKSLWETLEPSLVITDRHPLMFPFLVGEAKSAHDPGTFADNYAQMCPIIKKSLEIQIRLYDALQPCDLWQDGPLVWVLANRGQNWEVSASYPRRVGVEGCSRERHQCLVLWRGDIRCHDEALRLLLIMDYIYEWARGYHRSSVIDGLEFLAADVIRDDVSGMPSIAKHTVRSRHDFEDDDDCRPPVRPGVPVNDDTDREEEAPSNPVADSVCAVLRDASQVRSRFLGVLVTPDSLGHLNLNDGTSLLTQLGSTLGNVADGREGQYLYLKRCHLNDIEDTWTANRHRPADSEDPQETFLALLTFTAFISEDWQLNRELSIIAISTKVLRKRLDLTQRVKLGLDEKIAPKVRPFMELVDTFLKAPADATLAACIHGTSLTPSKRFWEAIQDGGNIKRTDLHPGSLLEVSKSPWRDLASQLLMTRHHVEALGDSVRESFQERVKQTPHSRKPCAYPWMEHPVIATPDMAVLVYSPPANPLQQESTTEEAAMFCLYCLNPSNIQEVWADLRHGRTALEECWNTERMTKGNQRMLRWNKLHPNQWSPSLMLQVAKYHIEYLSNREKDDCQKGEEERVNKRRKIVHGT